MRRGLSLVELMVYVSLFAIFTILTASIISDTYHMYTVDDAYAALSDMSQRLKIRLTNALTSTAVILDRDTAQLIWDRRGSMNPRIGSVKTTKFPAIAPNLNVEALPSEMWGNVLGVIRQSGVHRVRLSDSDYTLRLYQLTFVYPTLVRGRHLDDRIVLAYWNSEPFLSTTELSRFYDILPRRSYRSLRNALINSGIRLVSELDRASDPPRLRFYRLSSYPERLINVRYDRVLSNGTGEIIREFNRSYSTKASDLSIAFNTSPSPIEGYSLGFKVPAFIETDDKWFPSGFEVGVTGPNSARSLYIRVSVIARILRAGGKPFAGRFFSVSMTLRESY